MSGGAGAASIEDEMIRAAIAASLAEVSPAPPRPAAAATTGTEEDAENVPREPVSPSKYQRAAVALSPKKGDARATSRPVSVTWLTFFFLYCGLI